MMHLDEYVGSTVTIKTISGYELVAQLFAVNAEERQVVLDNIKQVVITGDQVALVPWTLTSNGKLVTVEYQHIFSIEPTLESTAEDYLSIGQAQEE
jgi:hypothetical protein